jgi:phospholipid/cholesterol/gamma-HCH transport system ATP-binding protein
MTSSTPTQTATPAVQVAAVRKSFGGQVVLEAIDLEVAAGETLAVLGRSGTGKSVLLKLIIGLQQPDAGSIRVHGQKVNGMALPQLNAIRKKVGFLFQSAALYDSMTVEQNVAFPLTRHTTLSDVSRRRRVKELLASVGLEKDLEKMPAQISGGMKKRVGLARALALEPDILLFDEPTAGLDPITGDEISALILKLQRERSMAAIIVTHDVQIARTVADRLAILRDGSIVVAGTYAEVQGSQDKFVARFFKASA